MTSQKNYRHKNIKKTDTCCLAVLYTCRLFSIFAKIIIMNWKSILKKFKNKYIIATLVFAVIIIFIDQYNIFFQARNLKKLNKAKDQVEYYEKEIKNKQEVLDNLHKDSAMMERIARENYMMKRDNEVIYIIESKE